MRPLRLEMRAFGPYAGRQVLDFADLKGRRFFLIHGPTGSGKTTVLDAMAFALYGDTSGAERNAADMRSDHAAADALTEVTFDFALGADRYRAWRRPAQERPKLRGDGVTVEPQDATLWRLKADGHDPLATGWTKVTAKAVEILGFRAEQFRQVVMLPQGRFQELLKADSAGRAEILATLFGTQYYARLERELKDAAAAARKALDSVAQERAFVLDAAGLESEEDLAAAREEADEAFALACEERARRDEARTAAESAEHAATDTMAKLEDARKSAAALEALTDKQPEIDLLRREEAQARSAGAVVPAAGNADERTAERKAAEEALAVALHVRDEAAESHRLAREALAVEAAREEERAAAERRRSELESLRSKIGPLEDAHSGLASAEGEVAQTERLLAEARDALAQAEEALSAADAAARVARTAAAETEGLEARTGAAEAVVLDRRHLDDLLARQPASEQGMKLAEDERAKAGRRWDEARDRLALLERQWAESQATVLARQLEPGAPCPVCGSTEHPAPARATLAAPQPEELAAARDAVEQALRERDTATAAQNAAAGELASLLKDIEAARARLGVHAERTVEECSADADAARAAAEASRQAAERLPRSEEALHAAQEAAEAARATVADAESAVRQAEGRLAAAWATLHERAAGLPDGLREPHALEEAIANAAEAVEVLRSAHDAAEAGERESALALGKATADHAAANKAFHTAQDREAVALDAFHEALLVHGFAGDDGEPSEAAWRAALRSDEDLAHIAAAIKQHDEELAAARGRADAAAAAAAGLEAPDLDDLRAKANAARKAAEDAASEAAKSQLRVDDLAETARKLADLHARNEDLDAKYAVVGHIARLASGDNSSGLTLQRFVLGSLLDTVLIAATLRLRSMSKGRYLLLRTDERRGGRRAAGLDMDVLDAWTGKSRPVSTLSGGESFLAALSLALGLAETVQARTGGVFLDTVFVDEGFGTLDDEALDLAIATLVQLQEGDRLVGIISHVPELKERIDARLEVTTERGTSTARFVVP